MPGGVSPSETRVSEERIVSIGGESATAKESLCRSDFQGIRGSIKV
jgi:hypothetical protein